jgi:hypothetical protein
MLDVFKKNKKSRFLVVFTFILLFKYKQEKINYEKFTN